MITSPQAVRFSNERVRVLADQVARVYALVSLISVEFRAKGIDAAVPDDDSVVDDGASADGRTPITGHDVHEMIRLADALLAMASGPDTRLPTVLKAAVNPS